MKWFTLQAGLPRSRYLTHVFYYRACLPSDLLPGEWTWTVREGRRVPQYRCRRCEGHTWVPMQVSGDGTIVCKPSEVWQCRNAHVPRVRCSMTGYIRLDDYALTAAPATARLLTGR